VRAAKKAARRAAREEILEGLLEALEEQGSVWEEVLPDGTRVRIVRRIDLR
jgi:acyl-CoA hydrolase